MEAFRDTLIAKIDNIIADLHDSPKGHPQIQIEATVIGNEQQNEDSRFVLGTFDVRQWKSPSQAPNSPFGRLRTRQQNQSSLNQQLPSPQEETSDSTRASSSRSEESNSGDKKHQRRRAVGGLRLGVNSASDFTPPRTPSPPGVRQLESDHRTFPKRRRLEHGHKLQPSTVDKLVEGIWEQIHRPGVLLEVSTISESIKPLNGSLVDFADVSRRCRVVTGASRTARAVEVIMQAHWMDCYDAKLELVKEQMPELRLPEQKRHIMSEACASFEWSEKDLRNRMAIWKGYREIKDAAGWAALVFAGPGIYRFCKYRLGFDEDATGKLKCLRSRFDVAVDTIQPQWRQLLAVLGVSTQKVYHGHPHSWVVSKRKDPVPLAWTYRQLHPNFTFDHIDTCVIDSEAWGTYDPRRVTNGPAFICTGCSRTQSELAEKNECECFSDLFGPTARTIPPVQVYSTEDGKNNGLIACCTFERGAAIGEFVGVITKGLQDVDVMQSQGAAGEYQIYQARKGNFTRFLNHSCNSNCQFQTFIWLGVQRTIIVSKGVAADRELTVDYSPRYWKRLDKRCLCGEAACRYRER